MKKIQIAALGLLMITLLNSCLLTLYPIYTDKDVVFRENIIGHYKKVKKEETEFMDIEPLTSYNGTLTPAIGAIKNKGYLVTLKNENNLVHSTMIAFIVELNDGFYMDFVQVPKPGRDPFFESMLVPMHAVYRLRFEHSGKDFTLQRFSSGFLTDLIEKKKIRISNEDVEHELVITASTADLQQYIIKYGNLADAYEKELETYIKY
jgi:hypothetical protein